MASTDFVKQYQRWLTSFMHAPGVIQWLLSKDSWNYSSFGEPRALVTRLRFKPLHRLPL